MSWGGGGIIHYIIIQWIIFVNFFFFQCVINYEFRLKKEQEGPKHCLMDIKI